MTTDTDVLDVLTEETRATVEEFGDVPDEMGLVAVRREQHDDRPVHVARHQRLEQPEVVLGGEHVTCTVDAVSGQLLGITRLLASQAAGPLPSRGTARHVADAYLARVAPDLVDNLEMRWIEPHDKVVTLAERRVTITGMKVKCFQPSNGRYAWVIVGPHQRVITFERDIAWDTGQSRRITPMWLHDVWIAAADGLASEPCPPAAQVGAHGEG
jgi:hypothetical protein